MRAWSLRSPAIGPLRLARSLAVLLALGLSVGCGGAAEPSAAPPRAAPLVAPLASPDPGPGHVMSPEERAYAVTLLGLTNQERARESLPPAPLGRACRAGSHRPRRLPAVVRAPAARGRRRQRCRFPARDCWHRVACLGREHRRGLRGPGRGRRGLAGFAAASRQPPRAIPDPRGHWRASRGRRHLQRALDHPGSLRAVAADPCVVRCGSRHYASRR